jgi:hypothetical protein
MRQAGMEQYRFSLNSVRPRRARKRGDVTTALTSIAPLTAADRCDRCGAQAYVRVVLVSGGQLLFCAHHAKKHGPELRKVAADIQDETARLSQTSAAVSDEEDETLGN